LIKEDAMRTFVLFCCLCTTLSAAEPLPDKAALVDAQRVVRDTYHDELTSEAGLKKILQHADGLKSATDQAAAYLVVSQEAAASGWLGVGFTAIDRLARRFDYDAPTAKASMLDRAAKRAKTKEDRVSIVNSCLELFDAAVADERFDVAESAMKVASGVVAKIRNADLGKTLAEKRKSLNAARDALKREEHNPQANETIGKRLAIRGEWIPAVLRLSRSENEGLFTAAQTDSRAQKDPKLQLAAADAWWSVAEGAEEKEHRAYRSRAVYWYTLALAGLAGLDKERAEKRIEEAGKVEVAGKVDLAGQVSEDGNKMGMLLAPDLPLVMVKIPGRADGKVPDFWLGQTEVTEAQWAAVMGGEVKQPKLPKVGVTQGNVRGFLLRINSQSERFNFRLPSPAEAELAVGDLAQYNVDTAWYAENSDNRAHEVATRKPNALGLFDVIGNVWEWCDDGHMYGTGYLEQKRQLGVRLQRPAGGDQNFAGPNLGFRVAAYPK
jgi:hypothetical protein